MNAYLVTIPGSREYVAEVVCDDGTGPLESWTPTGVYIADSAAQAKRDALHDWAGRPRTGVYGDDWTALRVRLLARDVGGPRRCTDDDDALWGRAHEVLDHAGAPCDCPEDVAAWCDVCGKPLDDGRPWQRALEGGGAHLDCLEAVHDEEEEERE